MKLLATPLTNLAITVTLGLLMRPGPCLGAAWEGTDDFAGTLAKWDTTYNHLDQPTDGFFLSGGHLQFIKTATTTNYGSSGVLIWPHSLPFTTNWVVLVDAHLKPLSSKTSNPIDQDITAELFVFESVESYLVTAKYLGAALKNGPAGDLIDAVGMDATPVAGGGWDFTLGLSFDSSTKIGTCFYYPINQSSQMVILTNVNMGSWTNIQLVIYALSEYWAVGPGENWLDNCRIYGTANASPNVGILKAVIPSFSNLLLGRSYQLQVSADITNWFSQGTPFVATNFEMAYPQSWAVDDWNKLFFRLQVLSPPLTPVEICINNLRLLDNALKAYARDYQKAPNAPATLADCMLYMSVEPVCPAGGTTLYNSYTVTTFGSKPMCLSPGGGVAHGHVLPP